MTKRMAVALASCLALSACGGDGGASNAAVGKTFTYGTPHTYYQDYTVTSGLSNVTELTTAPDATSAQDLASASIASSLLGTSPLGSTAPAQQQALAAGRRVASRQLSVGSAYDFDNPGCVTTTATSVTMSGCVYTYVGYGDTIKVTVGGQLSFDPSKGQLAYDFTVSAVDSATYGSTAMSDTANVHESGTVTVDATTISGQMLAEASETVNAGSVSYSLALSEAVAIDVTYADALSCSTRVTAGTLEAKRVWTDRGGTLGSQMYDTTDKAAKVTWTGCGQATIAYSN